MKVFELLQEDTERRLAKSLASFDWDAEFSEDTRRAGRAAAALNLLESAVYEYWQVNPSGALELWNAHAPQASRGIVPSFIRRLEAGSL